MGTKSDGFDYRGIDFGENVGDRHLHGDSRVDRLAIPLDFIKQTSVKSARSTKRIQKTGEVYKKSDERKKKRVEKKKEPTKKSAKKSTKKKSTKKEKVDYTEEKRLDKELEKIIKEERKENSSDLTAKENKVFREKLEKVFFDEGIYLSSNRFIINNGDGGISKGKNGGFIVYAGGNDYEKAKQEIKNLGLEKSVSVVYRDKNRRDLYNMGSAEAFKVKKIPSDWLPHQIEGLVQKGITEWYDSKELYKSGKMTKAEFQGYNETTNFLKIEETGIKTIVSASLVSKGNKNNNSKPLVNNKPKLDSNLSLSGNNYSAVLESNGNYTLGKSNNWSLNSQYNTPYVELGNKGQGVTSVPSYNAVTSNYVSTIDKSANISKAITPESYYNLKAELGYLDYNTQNVIRSNYGDIIRRENVSTTNPEKGQSAVPRDLKEQILYNSVKENPLYGEELNGMNNDTRFLEVHGFKKMQMKTELDNKKTLVIHYQYNKYTGEVYDIKIVTPQRVITNPNNVFDEIRRNVK